MSKSMSMPVFFLRRAHSMSMSMSCPCICPCSCPCTCPCSFLFPWSPCSCHVTFMCIYMLQEQGNWHVHNMDMDMDMKMEMEKDWHCLCWYELRAINTWVLRKDSSHYSSCCCMVLWWHSGSHFIINFITVIISLLQHPLRKSKLTLF